MVNPNDCRNILNTIDLNQNTTIILDWNFDRLYQKWTAFKIWNAIQTMLALVIFCWIRSFLVCSKYVVCTVQKARVSDNRTKIQNLECYSNHAGSCSSSVGSVHFLFVLSMSCVRFKKPAYRITGQKFKIWNAIQTMLALVHRLLDPFISCLI